MAQPLLGSSGHSLAIWYLAFSFPGGLTIAAMCPLVESKNRGRPPSSWVDW
jgi:hypothetical protein